jgi:hypothetical protein
MKKAFSGKAGDPIRVPANPLKLSVPKAMKPISGQSELFAGLSEPQAARKGRKMNP